MAAGEDVGGSLAEVRVRIAWGIHWMVLGVYIRSGRGYESWGMSHSGVQ